MNCRKDKGRKCGAGWRNSIFKLDAVKKTSVVTSSWSKSAGYCRRTDGKRFRKAWYVGNFKDSNQCQAKCEKDKNCAYFDWHDKNSKHYGACHFFMNETDGHTLKGEGNKWSFCFQKPQVWVNL